MYRRMKYSLITNKNEERHILFDLLFRPWDGWIRILTDTTGKAVVGLSVIIIMLIFFIHKTNHPLLYSIALLIWVGPVLIGLPFLLLFIVPNTLLGAMSAPIGCIYVSETGTYDCI
jgi:hypothetical protein